MNNEQQIKKAIDSIKAVCALSKSFGEPIPVDALMTNIEFIESQLASHPASNVKEEEKYTAEMKAIIQEAKDACPEDVWALEDKADAWRDGYFFGRRLTVFEQSTQKEESRWRNCDELAKECGWQSAEHFIGTLFSVAYLALKETEPKKHIEALDLIREHIENVIAQPGYRSSTTQKDSGQQWISVETPPKELEKVLAMNEFRHIRVTDWESFTNRDLNWFQRTFTHWLPISILPPLPSAPTDKNDNV